MRNSGGGIVNFENDVVAGCLWSLMLGQVRLKARAKIAGNLSETMRKNKYCSTVKLRNLSIRKSMEIPWKSFLKFVSLSSLKSTSHFPELSNQVSITATVSSIFRGHELPGEQ